MSAYGSVNPELLGMARANVARLEKAAFIPGGPGGPGGGDPSMGGGAPPGGDPSGGGGAPPGGDPSMGGGGAPPPGPPPGGSDPTAGVSAPTSDLSTMIQQQVQTALGAMGGGAGGAGGAMGMKAPKIDENVVMLQILKILAKISDHLGIAIPASEMVVTQQDLQAMAQGGPGQAAVQSEQRAGNSSIQPISPMQGASPDLAKMGHDRDGVAFDTRGFETAMNKASAIMRLRRVGTAA